MIKKLSILIISFLAIMSSFSVLSAQESSDSADIVRDKVKEKIQKVLNKPKAYIGTITDKTGKTLQIKNMQGEIQFISIVTDDTAFLSVGKTSKEIEYDEVAIGDFVIAMGYISDETESGTENGNSVLEAKRVLVTEEIGAPERKITFGNVMGIEKNILTLNSKGEESEYEFPKRWKGPEIDKINGNDQVAIVSVPDEGKTLIRTIEIIGNSDSDSLNNSEEE